MNKKKKVIRLSSMLFAFFISTNLVFSQPAHASGFVDDISSGVSSIVDSVSNWWSGLWSSGESSSASSEAEVASSGGSSGEVDTSNATMANESEQQQLINQIRDNNGVLPEGAHIKGKKQQPDGKYSVAISYEGKNGEPKLAVVAMDSSGNFSTINISGSNDAKELRKEYDAIMQSNELTPKEAKEADGIMHNAAALTQKVQEMYGVSSHALAATAAGAATMGGLFLAGLGATKAKREKTEQHARNGKGDAFANASDYSSPITPQDTSRAMSSIRGLKDYTGVCDKQMCSAIEKYITSNNGMWQGESLKRLASHIVYTANKYNLDPAVIAAQLKAESNFSPTAGSSAGAQGIAQFMPETAKGFGIDPLDVSQAIEGQCMYMAELKKNFGDYSLALAGYNAGAGAVKDYGGIPPYRETVDYVNKISDYIGTVDAYYSSEKMNA